MRALLLIAAVILSGCDYVASKLTLIFPDDDKNVVVLSKGEILLPQAAITLGSSEAMRVIGEQTMVCVVLRDGVALADQPTMDEKLRNALGGAKLTVDVVLSDGQRVPFSKPIQGWNRTGKVLAKGELSACVGPGHGVELLPGAVASSVELSSVPSLAAKGVYWESARGATEKRRQPANAQPSVVGQRPNPALNRTSRMRGFAPAAGRRLA